MHTAVLRGMHSNQCSPSSSSSLYVCGCDDECIIARRGIYGMFAMNTKSQEIYAELRWKMLLDFILLHKCMGRDEICNFSKVLLIIINFRRIFMNLSSWTKKITTRLFKEWC